MTCQANGILGQWNFKCAVHAFATSSSASVEGVIGNLRVRARVGLGVGVRARGRVGARVGSSQGCIRVSYRARVGITGKDRVRIRGRVRVRVRVRVRASCSNATTTVSSSATAAVAQEPPCSSSRSPMA